MQVRTDPHVQRTPQCPVACVARYYDPSTGQFLSLDPDVVQALSPFNYAGDDPVNLSDPSGLGFLGISCLFGKNPNGSCRGSSSLHKAENAILGTAHSYGQGIQYFQQQSTCLDTKQGRANFVTGAANGRIQISNTGRGTKRPDDPIAVPLRPGGGRLGKPA
jgi:hypothetical protein